MTAFTRPARDVQRAVQRERIHDLSGLNATDRAILIRLQQGAAQLSVGLGGERLPEHHKRRVVVYLIERHDAP